MTLNDARHQVMVAIQNGTVPVDHSISLELTNRLDVDISKEELTFLRIFDDGLCIAKPEYKTYVSFAEIQVICIN